MIYKKILTVRRKFIVGMNLLLIVIIFTSLNPIVCHAEELSDNTTIEQIEEVQSVESQEQYIEEPQSVESQSEEPQSVESQDNSIQSEQLEITTTESITEETTTGEITTEETTTEVITDSVSANGINEKLLIALAENEKQKETALTGQAEDINTQLNEVVALQTYITGILIFFAVVILCKYTYKFFNMFF